MKDPAFLFPSFILAVDALMDIKKREILPVFTLIGAAAGIFYQITVCKTSLFEIIFSMVPAVLLFALSCISSGQIGKGDSLVVLAAGIWSGVWDIWGIVLTGSFLAALFSIGLWIRRRKNASIPFAAFLAAGYGLFYVFGF